MGISKNIKDFIEEYKEFINNNNFDFLYSKLFKKYHTPEGETSSFTQLLYEVGIDPLKYLNYIPRYFLSHTNITEFGVPKNISSIKSGAFYSCTNLESIKIPENVKEMDSHVFVYCTNLKSVYIPTQVEKLDWSIFYGCANLKDAYLNKNLKLISTGAFLNCPSLKDIYYNGTKDEWEKVEKERDWISNYDSCTIHCVDGDIKI